MIYPIGFGIPECKIISSIPEKTQILAPLIPGKADTYIYEDEESYYKDYQKSIFGLTHKKAGWDCLRHYEILANGCIPYFKDIENCPKNTMTLFPKDIIKQAMLDCDSSMPFNYVKIIQELLDYTKKFLTTKAIAQYILDTSKNSDAKSVLYLLDNNICKIDYLRSTVLHGFKELFGKNCHDYSCYENLYTDYPKEILDTWYTKGMSYTRLLDKSMYRDAEKDKTIENDIKNKHYDIVILEPHYNTEYHQLVREYYPPNKLIYLCGHDIPDITQHSIICSEIHYEKDSHFFWREIPDCFQL